MLRPPSEKLACVPESNGYCLVWKFLVARPIKNVIPNATQQFIIPSGTVWFLKRRRTWKFLGTVKRLQQKFYAACSLAVFERWHVRR